RKGPADHTTDVAISQLSAFSKGAPFFLWVHYFDPHYPYQPPGAFATMYDAAYQGLVDGTLQTVDAIQNGSLKPAPQDVQKLQALYQGEISFLDSQIGRLFAQLSGSNIVVAVTGDHGESFGEHADLDENGNFFHPHSLYSSEQQVPLLLRYGPVTRPGSTIGATTQAIDLLPTLLQLAGAPVPAQAQGTSLLPLLNGSDGGTGRVAFSAMPDDVFTSVTSNGWRLIRNNVSGTQRLFNLGADPGEQHDLLPAQADQAASLGARLEGWMKEVKIAS
ncbi:MAG: sulfatase family protein, partial [Chloroflexota bacterium]